MGDTEMIKAIVVDNNTSDLVQTSLTLKGLGAFDQVILFDDSSEAAKYLELLDCDVVFTEVELKGITGFDLIRKFGNRHPNMCLVFLTNKGNYALEAFQAGATDFILKPIDQDGINRVMKKVKKKGKRC